MSERQRSTMIGLSVGCGIITMLVYLGTLTQVHTFDALSYILDVSRKPWQQLFHPHHLAYGPFGAAIVRLSRGVDVATALQSANAVAGSLGSAVFCAIVYRRWLRVDIALLATGALAFSYAYWYYAIEVEVYTLATLAVLWVLWLVMEPQPQRRRWQVSMALGVAGAVLFHQTNALLAVPLVVRAWPGLREPGVARRGWISAGVGAVTLVVAAYVFVMLGVSGFVTISDARHWLFDYVNSGWWGGKATASDLGTGLSDTIADGSGGIIGIALLALTATTLVHRRPQLHNVWLVVWAMTFAGFFGWWEPENIEFWIGMSPVVILLLMNGFAQLRATDVRVFLAYGLLGWTVWLNANAIRLRGDASTDLQRQIAHAVRVASQPADLLLVPDGLQELYLPYYEAREHFLSVNGAIAARGSWPEGCATVQQAVIQTHQAGAQVVFASDFLVPSKTMQRRYGLTIDAVTSCMRDYIPLLIPLPLPATVPDHHVLPTAGTLLANDMWATLNGPPIGWTLSNGRTEPNDSGWHMRVQSDPVIVSPILDIPMPQQVVIDLSLDATADTRGQLFVATALNQFDEAHAVAWELAAGQRRVVIDVSQIPALPERLIQLRIDPVADGADGHVTITGIRVLYP